MNRGMIFSKTCGIKRQSTFFMFLKDGIIYFQADEFEIFFMDHDFHPND